STRRTPTGAVRTKRLQAAREALGQVEQMYVKDVNRPVRPETEKLKHKDKSGTKGRRGTRIAEGAESHSDQCH
ncbi:hypothetical protein KI387_027188, partial [Taxus chinensis]